MKAYLEVYGERYEIDEIWEAINGDIFIWLKGEDMEEGYSMVWVRLYGYPAGAELGANRKDYVWSEYTRILGEKGIWKVSEKNWENVNSYNHGNEGWRIVVERENEMEMG